MECGRRGRAKLRPVAPRNAAQNPWHASLVSQVGLCAHEPSWLRGCVVGLGGLQGLGPKTPKQSCRFGILDASISSRPAMGLPCTPEILERYHNEYIWIVQSADATSEHLYATSALRDLWSLQFCFQYFGPRDARRGWPCFQNHKPVSYPWRVTIPFVKMQNAPVATRTCQVRPTLAKHNASWTNRPAECSPV